MAQPQQQQYPVPQRAFSPLGSTMSPVQSQQQSGRPPAAKRQRTSPVNSQPNSPYMASPYANTPATTPGQSPVFNNVAIPPNAYNTPYSNGHSNTQSNAPTNLTLPQSNHQHPTYPNQANYANQGQQVQAPSYNNFALPSAPASQNAGLMGPPSKPVDKNNDEDLKNPLDILQNTGIDLRAEEQFAYSMYNTSFNSQYSSQTTTSAGRSFPNGTPGDEASLYGAGPANAAGQRTDLEQDEFHKQHAEKIWAAAVRNLAESRQKELSSPFLLVNILQKKMDKAARENGLALNLDAHSSMGHMKLSGYFGQKEVNVVTTRGPDAAMVTTSGQFIPPDSMLVDQVALLSIATKHRLRGLMEDAVKLTKGRQATSHGVVPEEWVDVAVPSDLSSSVVVEGAPRTGWESAASPLSDPRKRSFSAANGVAPPVPSKAPKITNEVVSALRGEAQRERDVEEDRLRRRNGRTGGAVRSGSIVPGTPGSIAPDHIEKAPTKKEQKKKAVEKANEVANHTAANATTSQFLGGGSSLFGKKKKTYSWMTAGAGSGASTPSRIPGTPASLVNAAPEKLTQDGARRLGQWREDKEKGRGIQMRDWVQVLEADGREKKTLQKAYSDLDHSDPK